ncbi:unnamed protein product, partial [Brassica oleracea]
VAVSVSSPSSSTITPVTLNQKMKNDSWRCLSLRRNTLAVSAITGALGNGTGRKRLMICLLVVFSDACSVGNEQLILHLGVRPRLGIVQESVKIRAISTVHPKLHGLDLISSVISLKPVTSSSK